MLFKNKLLLSFLLSFSVSASHASEYQIRYKMNGMSPSCASVKTASELKDGFYNYCDEDPETSDPESKYLVSNGMLFKMDAVRPIDAFRCEGALSNYANDSSARALSELIKNPVYTPLNSFMPVSSSHYSSTAAFGRAFYTTGDGTQMYSKMTVSKTWGTCNRDSYSIPTAGTVSSLRPNGSYGSWNVYTYCVISAAPAEGNLIELKPAYRACKVQ